MNRSARLVLSILVGVAIAALIAFVQTMPQPQKESGGIAGAPIGNQFENLVDQNDTAVTADRFAGKYQMVFFGFTHCPAICPTELHRMTQVFKALDADEKAKLAPIFVSVDPARDTPAVMKEYLSMFDPAIIGLTGSEESVKATVSAWKVYAAKVPTEGGDYTMDHSAFWYLRGPDGKMVELFNTTDTPADIAQRLKAALKS